jgi:hypothetical protein
MYLYKEIRSLINDHRSAQYQRMPSQVVCLPFFISVHLVGPSTTFDRWRLFRLLLHNIPVSSITPSQGTGQTTQASCRPWDSVAVSYEIAVCDNARLSWVGCENVRFFETGSEPHA